MIVRLLALLILFVLLIWIFSSIARRFSLTRSQARLIVIVAAALTTIIVLVVLGRIPPQFILAPLGVAAAFVLRLLPTLLRLLPLWQFLRNKGVLDRNRKSGNDQKSVIGTEFLAMELNHGTGDMDGEVLKGRLTGRKLSSMSLDQLLELAQECRLDHDSIQVLEAYLDRMHDGWRNQARSSQTPAGSADEPVMNEKLAREILGLDENAGRDEVTSAHRKLMQKLHPDRGGTEYLAKKINAARDFLIEKL